MFKKSMFILSLLVLVNIPNIPAWSIMPHPKTCEYLSNFASQNILMLTELDTNKSQSQKKNRMPEITKRPWGGVVGKNTRLIDSLETEIDKRLDRLHKISKIYQVFCKN